MRPTVYIPLIAPEDFQVFKAMLGADLPDTYEAWRDLTENRIHQITRNGETAVSVEINPNEFAVWITPRGRHPALQWLDAYANFKGPFRNRD
jgi:hypothetical protein